MLVSNSCLTGRGVFLEQVTDAELDSKRILPRFYNGKFEKGEKKARETLQDLLETSPTRTRKKRGNSS